MHIIAEEHLVYPFFSVRLALNFRAIGELQYLSLAFGSLGAEVTTWYGGGCRFLKQLVTFKTSKKKPIWDISVKKKDSSICLQVLHLNVATQAMTL